MRRIRCSACDYEDLEVFLDLGDSPVADAYEDNAFAASKKYPLQLAVCTSCWLVQLTEVLDEEILFGTGYSFYTSASVPLVRYLNKYVRDISSRHSDLKGKLLVEIGCNDGTMLGPLQAEGFHTLGIDPAEGPVSVARKRDLDVLHYGFDVPRAEFIRNMHGPASIIVANHVLAHVESVAEMVEGIAHLLADDGFAYIEVQYLPDLLVNNAFDLVYHEHRNFFSVSSLGNVLYSYGLEITGVEQTDRQGGSIRLQVRHKDNDRIVLPVSKAHFTESWLRRIETYRGFQGRVERIRDKLLRIIDEVSFGADDLFIGYGAPAKATTLLNYCGIDNLDYVVDTTIEKQERYIPGVGTKIIAPDEEIISESQLILVMAWNYLRTILDKHRYSDFEGEWLVPIPTPMKL